jgi:hypothetical protein
LLPPGSSVEEPLVASGDVVVGTFYGTVPNPQPTCKLVDGADAIQARALGAVRIAPATSDAVLAWGSAGAKAGTLYLYPGSVFNGCVSQGTALSHDTGFVPGRGSQILSLDATHVLLQGHHDNDDVSLLQVYDATTMMPVGGSVSLPKLRTAAILDTGAQKYVIAGYPGEIVDGVTGGVVRLFKVSATDGIDSQPAALFNDAQPEDSQSFGRAVAAMPFNGKQIVAVAANNEIFMYFRLNLTDGTALYGETRQGR